MMCKHKYVITNNIEINQLDYIVLEMSSLNYY